MKFASTINCTANFDPRITPTVDPLPIPESRPCTPSPCGPNAICKEQNGAGSCSCVTDYIGNPYEGCRPECLRSSDCPSNQACVNSKCKDPCPGTCGPNAECHVVNHLAMCNCYPGYTGNPFTFCTVTQPGEKNAKMKASKIFKYICAFI